MPASDSPEVIEKLLKLGVNIFRFNLKHNEISWHEERIQRVHKIAKELDYPITVFIGSLFAFRNILFSFCGVEEHLFIISS